ncbi:MAG: hypothetical protein AB1349_14585 [Elusimicrobiota bacterium]
MGGGIDTLATTVDSYDYWSINGSDFIPPFVQGETLFVYIKKDTLGNSYKSKTWIFANNPSSIYSLEVCLDDPIKSVKAFTPNIFAIKDTSNVGVLLSGSCFLKKNQTQKCDAVVDTSTWSWYQIYDFYANLEKQDSIFSQGDSFNIRLEKTRNDTIWFTEVKSAIDTIFWDAMKVWKGNVPIADTLKFDKFSGDTLYFPQAFTVFRDASAESVGVDTSYVVGTIVTPKGKLKNNGTITQVPRFYFFIRDSLTIVSNKFLDII